MLTKKMEKALNEQINKELYSSYLYLAMASYFESTNLRGFAKWMRVQVMEESSHAAILYNYIFERGGTVTLSAIAAPTASFTSPLDAFEKTLEHEKFITSSIYSLVDVAREERDYATQNFLNWFVEEQVEEEANDNEIIEQLKLIGDASTGALFMLDQKLGTRIFAMPAPLVGKW